MQQIQGWLEKLGMSEYAQRFAENGIGFTALRHLTDQDLKDIGVLLGHRRIMLAAIQELGRPVAAQPATVEPKPHDTAERRQITIMFSDLVGSTALSTRMDPEDLREVISAYQVASAKVIQSFDGLVAKFMGDGILAYYGYPQAHEDDAERAVRAALNMLRVVSGLKTRAPEPLQIRIGIATGLVVVGDLIGSGEAQERGVVGETPNLAARLQSLATPNSIVVGPTTRRILGDLFEYNDLGRIAVKGFDAPVQAYQVLRPSSVESRFEALRTTTTPLVGRDEEIEILMRRWNRAKQGDGSVVLLCGEPGIGKSRITQAVQDLVAIEPHTCLRYFCSPHHQDSALYPVISQLERAAGFRREDTPEQRLWKLEAVLAQATDDLGDAVPLLADLLSIPTGDRYQSLDVTPQKRKEKTIKALLAQVAGLAAQRSVLMVFEDLHWLDSTSREVMDLIIDQIPKMPVLLILTFRQEFAAPWVGRPHVTMLTLSRLPPRERAQMISGVIGGKSLPKEIADQIIERTDGIPLFVEELTKAVIESGVVAEAGDHYEVAGPLTPLAIPTSLHASLLARLDRLAPVRELAQIAAALGRSFSHELISATAEVSRQKLETALDQLVAAELIFRRGTPPDAEYTFKHALVQDAAYGTLLKSRRQQIHGRIATTLEEKFPDIVANQPALIAHHCTEAGLVEKAVRYWVVAGDVSERRAMTQEAIAHYRAANALLSAEMPVDLRGKQPELLMKLGNALMQAEGYSSVAALESYQNARSLAAALSQPENFAKAALGLSPLLFSQCHYEQVLKIITEVSSPSLDKLGPITRVHLLTAGVVANFGIGQYQTAWELAEKACLLDDRVQCTHNNPIGGGDPAIAARHYAVRVGTILGYFEDCLSIAQQALATARARNHAFSVAWALLAVATVHRFLGNYREAIRPATEAIEICKRHGFDARMGTLLQVIGAAHFSLGETELGLAEIRRGFKLWRDTSGFHLPSFLSELADYLLRVGRMVEAESAIVEGEEIVAQTDERSHVAELLRIRGLISAMKGDPAKGVEKLREAIQWSRMRGTKLFELRALRDLTRLQLLTCDCTSTKAELQQLVNWFPANLETPELREVRELLRP